MNRKWTLAVGLVLFLSVAAQASAQGPQQQQVTMPDAEKIVLLVRNSLITLNDALQTGKEFGNRAQCNPTYFTVGNLLRHLMRLRDEQRLSVEDIVERNVLLTFGACGPCRFGSYITEYRKALHDAGFAGFRVIALMKRIDIGENAEASGLALTPRFYMGLLRSLIAADVINVMGYRMRPYEVVAGSTDAAVDRAKRIVAKALAEGGNARRALRRCRQEFAKVELDYLRPKPKVAIIGEFWAMTTEGDGNYRLQRFLEAEGAECDIQVVTTWILYEFWCLCDELRQLMLLRRRPTEKHRSDSERPLRALAFYRACGYLLEKWFQRYARALGLRDYALPDLDELARITRDVYPSRLSGGEGHIEVAKVMETARKNKAHMVVSVKPFGCLPSSGVSDGVQALVTARYPNANFCAIETSGDGAASAYSRIQMALFKARNKAKEEFQTASADTGLTVEQARNLTARAPDSRRPSAYPPHAVACTGANALYRLAGRKA